MSDLSDLIKRALEIRIKFDEQNVRDGQAIWSPVEKVAGLNGDVGKLTQLVMAKENKRRTPSSVTDVDEALMHEFGDVLWQVIDLADSLGIDLEQAFLATMDELDERLAA